MTIKLKAPETTELRPRITVLGVGGAGGNAVNNMIAAKLEGVDFVVANTDAQALAQSKAERRIQLGARITEGLGAGAQSRCRPRGRRRIARRNSGADLSGSHMVFITAGMGGGTGTGAAPVIARAVREAGHAHGRRRHQAVRLRRREAHAHRRTRHRGIAGLRRYADRHSEPESVPRRQRPHDIRAGLHHGRRSAAFRRARRDRSHRHAGPHQSRFRRHQDGDGARWARR